MHCDKAGAVGGNRRGGGPGAAQPTEVGALSGWGHNNSSGGCACTC